MKHAYLLIVHHEFELLNKLLIAIDDHRNDIFIHFDKKVQYIPKLSVQHAGLYILDNRIDVRWGDVSQIQSEYVLFEAANLKGPYSYYHLLSGVDMPLKNQNEIHQFFNDNLGYEFIGFTQGDIKKEIERKVMKYHLFPRYFRHNSVLLIFLVRVIRYITIRLQYLLGYSRNNNVEFKKGTSWVSVTEEFVTFLLSSKTKVLKMYRNSFCADEIFLHTLCWNSIFRSKIYDIKNEANGCKRLIGWKDGDIVDWKDNDYLIISRSDAIFARKFNSKNMVVVNRILNKIITK